MANTQRSDTAIRRQQFFEYFRKRAETAARQDIPVPDRLFLLSGCLDALAKHWHSTADPTTTPVNFSGSQRMRAFLVQHGGHAAFEKVSAPMLRNATGKELGTFPFSTYKPNQMNKVIDWRADPNIAELNDAQIKPEILLRWSYPGILYVDLRCAWVHNFVPENPDIIIHDADFLGRGEPYYRYIGDSGRFLLMMPLPFLLVTLERAIQSFESQTAHRNVLPFKE